MLRHRSIDIRHFIESEIDRVCISRAIRIARGTQINDVVTGGLRLDRKIHIQLAGFRAVVIERQVNRPRCSARCHIREHLMIGRNLLTHNDNLVPLGIRFVRTDALETRGSIDKRIPIAPDEIDLAQLGQEILTFRFDRQRAVDKVRGLIVKAVRHVEIRLGNWIGLVEINGGIT